MKKNFTKKSGKVDKQVTDFFPRKSGQSSSQLSLPASTSQLPPFSMTTRSGGTKGQRNASRSDQEIISISSTTSASDTSSVIFVSELPPKHTTTRRITKEMNVLRPQNKSILTAKHPVRSSAKRPRSPDVECLGSSPTAFRLPMMPNKRKKNAEIKRPRDSTFIKQQPSSPCKVISISSDSTNNRKPSHKTTSTLASRTLTSSQTSKRLVASSQSDELELALPSMDSRDPAEVKENVQRWREQAADPGVAHTDIRVSPALSAPASSSIIPPSSTPPISNPADIQQVPVVESSYSHTETVIGMQLRPQKSTNPYASSIPSTPAFTAASLTTPNTEDKKALPQTPHSKAARRAIEEITARAYAAALSSDDEMQKSLHLKDLDESDDELDRTSNLFGKTGITCPPQVMNDIFSSPLSSVPSSCASVKGWRPRSHSSSSSSSFRSPTRSNKRTVPARSRAKFGANHQSQTLPKVLPKKKAQYRKQATNPLDALLRERDLERKRGNDMAALRQAETAVKKKDKFLATSVEGELVAEGSGLNHIDLADEDAAWNAIRLARLDQCSSPGGAGAGGSGEVVVGDREAAMLGSQAGDVITKILASDRASKCEQKSKDKVLGVSLWRSCATADDMVIDSGVEAAIRALAPPALKDLSQEALPLLLSVNILQKLGPKLPALISPLFASAIYPDETPLTRSSFVSLRDLWTYKNQPGLQFSLILNSLFCLGADPDVLKSLQWTLPADLHPWTIKSTLVRKGAIYRVIDLTTTAARSGSLRDHADVALGLVLIGLDPSSSSDVRNQIITSIDAICSAVDRDPKAAIDTEAAIYKKISAYAYELTPVNQAHLLTYFSCGSGRARHIAQWVAYSLLTDQVIPFNAGLPLLDKLVNLLAPASGSGLLFDVTSDMTDYEDLGHYVDILGIALADIKPYIADEEQPQGNPIHSIMDSPGGSKKPLAPLEAIKTKLEVIHGKIVDTRAAYLDRSRTKSSIQRLFLRLYFQRADIIKNSKGL